MLSKTVDEYLHPFDLKEFIAWIPNSFFQQRLLYPMRLATHGTILAAQLALEHGWSINSLR